MFLRRLITSDIPFARDDAHRLLPAMIACLIAFAALLVIVALSLHRSLDAQSRAMAGVLQVEIPADVAANVTEKVIAQLQRTSGVEEVTSIDRRAMETLLKPWMGEDFSINHLPMPTLLEVQTRIVKHRTVVNVADIRQSLKPIADDIRVTERGPWVHQLATTLAMLQLVVLVVAGLLLLCVVGMLVLVARTNLKLHFKTVGLLHMFGATDEYILQQFQRNGAWIAARGAFAGTAIAAILFLGAVSLSSQLQSPVIPTLHFTVEHAVVLVFLPVVTAFIAWIATRLTVRTMLHQMH